MNHKVILLFLAASILAFTHSVEAQQPKKIPRIGILRLGSPPDPAVEMIRLPILDSGEEQMHERT
jgi:hypothetical protein